MILFLVTYWQWFAGTAVTLSLYLHKLYLDKLKAQAEEEKRKTEKHKQEIDDLGRRLEKVEKVDDTAYPEFIQLKKDHVGLEKEVTITQAQKIHNIQHDLDLMRMNNEQRFVYHERLIEDFKTDLTEIKTTIKSNFDRLLEEILKRNDGK